VVGLDNITGLQTARIMRGHGVPVFGIAANRRHFGSRTNACAEVLVTDYSDGALVDCLQDLGKRLARTGVLLPCSDQTVAVLSRNRAELTEWFALPLAQHDVVDMLMDKVRFARHAAAAGLPIPHTEVLNSRSDVEAVADRLPYPSVLKPPAKSALWDQHVGVKGVKLTDATTLLRVYDEVAAWAPQLLVQEWVEGGERELLSCNCYFDRHGEPQATFVARKVRQWPPGVGTSASGEECRDDEVLDTTLRLFGAVGFHGLAYLELKRDIRTGRLLIIEPNVGRPTGRSAIAEAGGVELVYAAYCDALEMPLPESRQQYRGTKWLDVRRDIQAAVVAWRRGELTLGQWVRSVRGPTAHAIWSARDPLPFAVDVITATSEAARMVARLATGACRGALAVPVGPQNGVTVSAATPGLPSVGDPG
jgi:predicted ATP-grasp superfamily ATP-dependent carboligase